MSLDVLLDIGHCSTLRMLSKTSIACVECVAHHALHAWFHRRGVVIIVPIVSKQRNRGLITVLMIKRLEKVSGGICPPGCSLEILSAAKRF